MADRTKLGFTPGPGYDPDVDHAPDKAIARAVFDGKAAFGGGAKQMAGPHGTDNQGDVPGTSYDYENDHGADQLGVK